MEKLAADEHRWTRISGRRRSYKWKNKRKKSVLICVHLRQRVRIMNGKITKKICVNLCSSVAKSKNYEWKNKINLC
jgi:hypothetical protein